MVAIRLSQLYKINENICAVFSLLQQTKWASKILWLTRHMHIFLSAQQQTSNWKWFVAFENMNILHTLCLLFDCTSQQKKKTHTVTTNICQDLKRFVHFLNMILWIMIVKLARIRSKRSCLNWLCNGSFFAGLLKATGKKQLRIEIKSD